MFLTSLFHSLTAFDFIPEDSSSVIDLCCYIKVLMLLEPRVFSLRLSSLWSDTSNNLTRDDGNTHSHATSEP